MVTKNISDRN